MSGPTRVEGDLVPRADRARPATSISAETKLSKVWKTTTSREGYPKHLGSSDGSGESSAISASSTILPTSPDSQAHDTEDITSPPSLNLEL